MKLATVLVISAFAFSAAAHGDVLESEGWTRCAPENAVCEFKGGTQQVRFAAEVDGKAHYAELSGKGSVDCTEATFEGAAVIQGTPFADLTNANGMAVSKLCYYKK